MVHLSAPQIFHTLAVPQQDAAVLMAELPVDNPADWRGLAAGLALAFAQTPCRTFGICGGQGAGKSTLSALLAQALQLQSVNALVLSLDDFYLTRAERQRLAEREHPLLATRGVPGTHDVGRLAEVLHEVLLPGRHRLPVFDKGRDDRSDDPFWFEGPADTVILEGWCVGVAPEPDVRLVEPVNALERVEDPQGRWRGYVNICLRECYAPIWQQLDKLLYLAVPDIRAVLRWRGEQELERPPAMRMSTAQIARFVAHYERLTLWMRETLTESAQIVGYLDPQHRLEALKIRG